MVVQVPLLAFNRRDLLPLGPSIGPRAIKLVTGHYTGVGAESVCVGGIYRMYSSVNVGGGFGFFGSEWHLRWGCTWFDVSGGRSRVGLAIDPPGLEYLFLNSSWEYCLLKANNLSGFVTWCLCSCVVRRLWWTGGIVLLDVLILVAGSVTGGVGGDCRCRRLRYFDTMNIDNHPVVDFLSRLRYVEDPRDSLRNEKSLEYPGKTYVSNVHSKSNAFLTSLSKATLVSFGSDGSFLSMVSPINPCASPKYVDKGSTKPGGCEDAKPHIVNPSSLSMDQHEASSDFLEERPSSLNSCIGSSMDLTFVDEPL
ncbi:hypothetical protein Tco_1530859 [Tanacetum coccineum]